MTKTKYKNLTGQKYEYFTVISEHRDENNKLKWKCKCCCGNEFIATRTTIESSKIKSCGCMRKKLQVGNGKKRSEIKIGDTFGELEVLSVSYNDNGKALFHCYCKNCGNTIDLSASHLKKRYSCGCLTSGENESFIHTGKMTVRNTSGTVGVSYNREKCKWRVRIGTKHIGYFDKLEDAVKARKEVEAEIYDRHSEIIDKQGNYLSKEFGNKNKI